MFNAITDRPCRCQGGTGDAVSCASVVTNTGAPVSRNLEKTHTCIFASRQHPLHALEFTAMNREHSFTHTGVALLMQSGVEYLCEALWEQELCMHCLAVNYPLLVS